MHILIHITFTWGPGAVVGSIGSNEALDARGTAIDPRVQHIFLRRFGHDNISMAILPLPLIQEEQLSVNGERMYT